ncbi:MAG: response regulator [candidate division WOR-3 bacterium]|nr:response regulator [candidate division WOR-3 bacterium]
MGKTILIIDDEIMITDILSKIISRIDYDTHVCRNGQEAMQFFKDNHHNIALTVLDMIMPGMDGRETFIAIREIDPYAKILIVSGYSSQEDVRDLLEKGDSEFLGKPFRSRELIDAIKTMID